MNCQEHYDRLSFFENGVGFKCDACDRSYGVGLSCAECKFSIHGDCTFVFSINDMFDHPSHDGHCLKLLTTGAPDHTNPKCHLCGKNTKRLLYHCSDCKLNLDMDCIIDALCARANLNMPWHHHPLIMFDFQLNTFCEVCFKICRRGYLCPRCSLVIHEGCVSVFDDSPEITHPFHVRHPLKLIANGAPDYTDGKCHLTGFEVGKLLYHCDICKFNLNMDSAISNATPVALSDMKVHDHGLILMPRLISFVCDACGTKGDRSPYVCVQCDFMMFHQKCAHLPLVIHVNHHDHRVSYKYPLGLRELRCGVCFEEIDWSYGAYSCSLCPNYAIHSLCATRKDVWDGNELDGVPEEVENIEPFKRNDDNTITHFAHKHNLMSLSKGGEESSLCGGCVLPIDSYTFYKCSKSDDCSFILHETCADILKKKRHFLSPQPLDLCLQDIGYCTACRQVCCKGFMYSTSSGTFDLRCSSITVPFIHGSHEHHLLYLKLQNGDAKKCNSCGIDEKGIIIGCTKCNYFLDFHCATLPSTVTLPRYDDHPLTLCYGDEKARGKYWCDICERETNPKFWFYTCKDCGVTLHVFCVVGDIRYAQRGAKVRYDFSLLPNNTSSRPLCNNCHSRCPGPFVVNEVLSIFSCCSYYCFVSAGFEKNSEIKLRCPPWAELLLCS